MRGKEGDDNIETGRKKLMEKQSALLIRAKGGGRGKEKKEEGMGEGRGGW